MHPFTLTSLLDANVARGGALALVRGEEAVTYDELIERSCDLALRLMKLGVKRGDRVCLHLPKSIDEAVLTYAIARAGAVVVNINAIVTLRQLRHALTNSGARILLCQPRKAKALLNADPNIDGPEPPELEVIVTVGGALDDDRTVALDDVETAPGELPRLIGADPGFIMYTSGSTGLPKGVLLTHETVLQSARSAASHLHNREDDRAIGVLPLSFDFGLSQLTTMALVGGTLVMPKATIPTEVVRTIDTHDVNALAMVPTMWIPLVRLLVDQSRALDGIRYVANSGGPLPTDVQKAWPKVFPNARPYLMYGMTEGFRSTYLPPEDFLRKPGSIGVPLPDVEIYVVDDDKGICGPGELGQIIHRSSSLISSGYYRNPEATAEKIAPCAHLAHLIGDEPVLYSGDTGHLDEEGYLFFAARTSTFIKCSDFRISPTEVEDVVFSSGLVTDVVAFGRPDELLGQVVHIAVTGVDGGEVDLDGIRRHCKKTLPPYAIPREIHVWEGATMPRTANGKVDRPKVIDRFSV